MVIPYVIIEPFDNGCYYSTTPGVASSKAELKEALVDALLENCQKNEGAWGDEEKCATFKEYVENLQNGDYDVLQEWNYLYFDPTDGVWVQMPHVDHPFHPEQIYSAMIKKIGAKIRVCDD